MAVHQSLELTEASCEDDGHLRTGKTKSSFVFHILFSLSSPNSLTFGQVQELYGPVLPI